MATAPLFVTDLATLKKRLRLSGASGVDVNEMIEESVRRVRLNIYDRLGATRVAAIVGFSPSVNPTTANERERAKGEVVEVLWVKRLLMCDLPVLFLDGGGSDSREAWNEEGLTRLAGTSELQPKLDELDNQIATLMDELDDTTDDSGPVRATCIGPATPPPLPFDTIKPALLKITE